MSNQNNDNHTKIHDPCNKYLDSFFDCITKNKNSSCNKIIDKYLTCESNNSNMTAPKSNNIKNGIVPRLFFIDNI